MPTILFDARLMLPKPTGIGQYIASLLPELVRQAPDWQFHLLHKPDTFAGYGVADWDFPNLTKHATREPHMSLAQHGQLPRWATRLGADLLHYPHFDAPVWLSRVPVVSTLYDVKYLVRPDFFTALSKLKLAYMRFCYRATWQKATAVCTISHHTANDLRQLFGAPRIPVAVTPLAADPAFQPQPAETVMALRQKYQLSRPFILSVGERRPHKNHPTLIAAYAQSRARLTHDLVIIGQPYAAYHAPEEAIAEYGLHGRVHLLENVSFADLITFYSAADVFALVSLYEGYGLPVIEAMACDTAVIASNSTALAEVTGTGGWQLNPLDKSAIAEALSLLTEDISLREKWVAHGRVWAKQYSWADTATQTLAVYRQALPHNVLK
jgi:glycosyltransferase involved in cell wall biosynthesis